MSEPESKYARRYDREFKENAVALVSQGRSQNEVARDLSVSAWSLGEWVKQAGAGPALKQSKTLDAESDQERELRRLRAENDCLRQQRDIFKKALGICSVEPSGARSPAEGSPQGSAGGRWQMPSNVSR